MDAATDSVIRQYPGVDNPHGLVATPDGEYVITASLKEATEGTEKGKSNLFMVHPAHGHVMQTVEVEGWSHHQAITPDGRYVLSTHPTRNQVSVLDVESSEIAATVKTGAGPYYLVVTKDGSKAYVSNAGAGTVDEIDLSNWSISRTLEAGPGPKHMTLSKDDKILYVSNSAQGSISAITLDGTQPRQQQQVGKNLHGLDISDDGRKLFVTSQKEDKLVALNPDSGEIQKISLSPRPYHLNSVEGTGKVYVTSRSTPQVWVIDQQSMEVIRTFELPAGEGHQMAIVKEQ
ncbi:hypothetical protein BGP75_16710 [Motiliproteus sp. MSK22-1]|nr:hypothetical protein BGP75_16710 [Motiliproteus sp. MSK22-1]